MERVGSERSFNIKFGLSNVFQNKVCEDPSVAWGF